MEMTMSGRRELTNVVRLRHSGAGKAQKSKILDEFVASTGYCRKYAIGLLGKPPREPPARPRAGGAQTPANAAARVLSIPPGGPRAHVGDLRMHLQQTAEGHKGIVPDLLDRLHTFRHLNLGANALKTGSSSSR